MNLKEKTQTRTYEQITGDAEKYLVAAIDALNDRNPGNGIKRIAFGGSSDFSHIHIIINDESKVVLNRKDDQVELILDDTEESVILNDSDAQDVKELILDKLPEAAKESKRNELGDTLRKMLVLPLVLNDLRKEGRDPNDVTPREMLELAEKKIKEIEQE